MKLLSCFVVLAAMCTQTVQVDHRWDSTERRWRDGGVQVTPRAVAIQVHDLSELDRTPVHRLGTLVVHTPPEMPDAEFDTWLVERTAELGGTHFIEADALHRASASELESYAWMGDVRIADRDVAEGADHYVVFRVRPDTWVSLPTSIQPEPR